MNYGRCHFTVMSLLTPSRISYERIIYTRLQHILYSNIQIQTHETRSSQFNCDIPSYQPCDEIIAIQLRYTKLPTLLRIYIHSAKALSLRINRANQFSITRVPTIHLTNGTILGTSIVPTTRYRYLKLGSGTLQNLGR
jgi:hypothetical protein